MTDYEGLDETVDSRFETMHKMLDRLRQKLKKYDGFTAIQFVQPISDMLIEAIWQLSEEEQKRESDGDNLLNRITGSKRVRRKGR
jgi:hypothetical protein